MDEKYNQDDWAEASSIRAPLSVIKRLDNYKKRHGYTSRPQAIISLLEKGEQCDMIEDIRSSFRQLMEDERSKLADEFLAKLTKRIIDTAVHRQG